MRRWEGERVGVREGAGWLLSWFWCCAPPPPPPPLHTFHACSQEVSAAKNALGSCMAGFPTFAFPPISGVLSTLLDRWVRLDRGCVLNIKCKIER